MEGADDNFGGENEDEEENRVDVPKFDQIFYYFLDQKYQEFTIIFGTTKKDIFIATYQLMRDISTDKWNLLKMNKIKPQV